MRGVGLSLTEYLVRAMGGDIGYEPIPAGGSRFWFTLPLATSRDAAGAERGNGSAHYSR